MEVRYFLCSKYMMGSAACAYTSVKSTRIRAPAYCKYAQKREAPETFLDDCGHPKHAALHLKVSPISGCDGFEVAKIAVRH
jgi:hypothetical protein